MRADFLFLISLFFRLSPSPYGLLTLLFVQPFPRTVRLLGTPPSLSFLPFVSLTSLLPQVARSIKGQMLRNRFDVFSDWRDGIKELWDAPGEEYSRDRFQRGLPVPVCAFLVFHPPYPSYFR